MRLYRLILLVAALLPGFAFGGDDVDLNIVHRIKAEAFNNSQVMDNLFYLTDVNGPRLTGSPGFDTAAHWALERAKQFGAQNAHLEPWSGIKRGWSFSQFEVHLTKPVYAPLHGVPLAWCEGTNGPVTGELIAAPFLHEDDSRSEMDIATLGERLKEYRERWTGKLRGKMVLADTARDLEQSKEAISQRLDDKALSSLAEESELMPAPKPTWIPDRLPRDAKKRKQLFRNLPLEIDVDEWVRSGAAYDQFYAFLRGEGATVVIRTDKRGIGGTLFAEGVTSCAISGTSSIPAVKIIPEHYNRLIRLLEKNIPVELGLNLTVMIREAPRTVNVIAEIPGDKKKDEVVMLGGHLDSWHAGTGATDNAAGCAIALEALRILKSLDVKMARTVRLALWSGEEQGLIGSRYYVREHFGDPTTMKLKPEHAKFCVYFNLDNGSGKIRGIHLQGNDMLRPVFESWLAPFKDLGANTITIRGTGGTDHLSFDAIGLPGFQFIQDPLDYGTRTHHSDMDVYDHAEPGDLMQAAAIMASFVYDAATREAPLTRKPLPKPLPPKPPAPANSN